MEPRIAAAAILFLLGACAPDGRTDGGPADRQPPPGAIHVEEGSYMVELGTDDAGCRQYSAWSSTGAVVAAVYYRKTDGGFTLFRTDADCDTGSR